MQMQRHLDRSRGVFLFPFFFSRFSLLVFLHTSTFSYFHYQSTWFTFTVANSTRFFSPLCLLGSHSSSGHSGPSGPLGQTTTAAGTEISFGAIFGDNNNVTIPDEPTRSRFHNMILFCREYILQFWGLTTILIAILGSVTIFTDVSKATKLIFSKIFVFCLLGFSVFSVCAYFLGWWTFRNVINERENYEINRDNAYRRLHIHIAKTLLAIWNKLSGDGDGGGGGSDGGGGSGGVGGSGGGGGGGAASDVATRGGGGAASDVTTSGGGGADDPEACEIRPEK